MHCDLPPRHRGGIGSSFSQKNYPNASCPLYVVAAPVRAAVLRVVGGRPTHGRRAVALGRHLAGKQVSYPQAAPLWAPLLCGLAERAALALAEGPALVSYPLSSLHSLQKHSKNA
ncbi:hypothetical protein B296_00020351 [Ensete ventricosum]|uniref:Uncharacterized protein n=1 Tax=Ensete ventricosum TaxID=4639 RepID=A0A426YGJ9_ENSVE|nr:hypothetical protein B296_00020351 [Ensete ventricosum]